MYHIHVMWSFHNPRRHVTKSICRDLLGTPLPKPQCPHDPLSQQSGIVDTGDHTGYPHDPSTSQQSGFADTKYGLDSAPKGNVLACNDLVAVYQNCIESWGLTIQDISLAKPLQLTHITPSKTLDEFFITALSQSDNHAALQRHSHRYHRVRSDTFHALLSGRTPACSKAPKLNDRTSQAQDCSNDATSSFNNFAVERLSIPS